MIPRRNWHQTLFIAAGIYNLLFGILSSVNPQWLFQYSGMELPKYPEIFACLGMVVGLYGILYLNVARIPEQGWLVAAVGLLGKILGPIGWTVLFLRDQWPLSSGILCLTNDLIWWIPFSIYLRDAWPLFYREWGK